MGCFEYIKHLTGFSPPVKWYMLSKYPISPFNYLLTTSTDIWCSAFAPAFLPFLGHGHSIITKHSRQSSLDRK